jgi:hypothetical protein
MYSVGIICSSELLFRKACSAGCMGSIPSSSLVIIALVAEGTLNSFAANFKTAVKDIFPEPGSIVSMILKETFDMVEMARTDTPCQPD